MFLIDIEQNNRLNLIFHLLFLERNHDYSETDLTSEMWKKNRDRGDVLAEALKTMLWDGRQHDMQRAAAFIKRLATFSLSFGTAEAMSGTPLRLQFLSGVKLGITSGSSKAWLKLKLQPVRLL